MADLGTIAQTNPNAGTQPVDTRTLERAVSSGLGAVAAAHTDRVLADAGEQIEEAIQGVVDEKAAGQRRPGEVDVIDLSVAPEVDELRRRVVDLKQDVLDGSVSESGRAQLEIDRTLAQLRKSHPKLAAQISAEVNATVAASPALTNLGLQDAFETAAAIEARKQLTFMRDRAVKNWSDGGLGMPAESDFTNPDVLADYLTRSSKRERVEAQKMKTAVLIADASASAGSREAVAAEILQGPDSGFSEVFVEQANTLREFTDEIRKPIEEQDRTIIDGFTAEREAIIVQNATLKFDMQQAFDALWPTPILRATPEYARSKAMFDDKNKQNDAWTAGVASVKDAKYYDIQEAVLKSEAWERRLTDPILNQFLQWQALDPDGNIYKMIKDSPTGANIPVQQLVSTAGVALAKSMWGHTTASDKLASLYENSGRGKGSPALSVEEITRILNKDRQTGPYPIDAKTTNETQEIQAGIARVAEFQEYMQLMVEIPEYATDVVAGDVMLATTSILLHYKSIGDQAPDQNEATIDMLSDPALLHTIRVVGDATRRNVRFAFQGAAKDYMGNDNRAYAQERTKQQDAWRAPRSGTSLNLLVQTDIDYENNDQITVVVLEDRVIEAVYNDSLTALPSAIGPLPLSMWKTMNQPLIEREIRRVENEAQAVLDFANKDVRASAHVMFAGSSQVTGANEPAYALWADRTGWLDLLGAQ